jgi:cytidylate kinase
MNNRLPASIETHIHNQIAYWQQQKEKSEAGKEGVNPFVTISREYGCGAYAIAETIAETLNRECTDGACWVAYDRKVLDAVMEDMGLSSRLAETLTFAAKSQMSNLFQTMFSTIPPQVAVYQKLAETVHTLAINGRVVIVGRAASAITRGMPGGYHVRVVAPLEWKVSRLADLYEMGRREAEKMIIEKGRKRVDFLKNFVKFDSENPVNYHLVINNAEHGPSDIARIVLSGMRLKGLIQ